MPRLRKHIAVLMAGACLMAAEGPVLPNSASAQEIDRLTVFSGQLRRSIGGGTRSTDNLDFSTADGRRGQLTGEETFSNADNTATPTPRPATTIPLSPRVQARAQPASAAPVVFNPESADQLPQQNLPAEAVQSGTNAIDEFDPFAAPGFRIGTFEGSASLEQTIGYSSNVSQNVGGEGGAFSQTDAQLDLVSNWSLHELRFGINGSYRRPFDSNEIDRPQVGLTAAHRLDLSDGMTLTTSGFYDLQTQEFTDSVLAPGAVDTPEVETYGGAIELQRSDRKLQFTLRGGIQQSSFDDADLGGGLTFAQGDLDNTEYEVGLRVGYEVSPAITPFVETIFTQQEFDQAVDRNGNRRDNDRVEVRGGVEVDLGEKLQGEASVGYVTQSFDDPLLADLDGFTLNGALNWSPERDTQITLNLGTQTNTSIAANENGSLIYTLGLAAERQVTDRLSVDARLDYQLETNGDRNTTVGFGVGVQYWLNRYMALIGDAEYNSFSSDAPNSDFDEFSVRAGVRLQR